VPAAIIESAIGGVQRLKQPHSYRYSTFLLGRSSSPLTPGFLGYCGYGDCFVEC
jgi:hypothetical protein